MHGLAPRLLLALAALAGCTPRAQTNATADRLQALDASASVRDVSTGGETSPGDVPGALGADATGDASVDASARPDASGATCGTRGAAPCPEGYFCDFPIAARCGQADAPGACQPLRTVCNENLRPVCGCDGRSYDNACHAAVVGVSVAAQGRCPRARRGARAAVVTRPVGVAQDLAATGAREGSFRQRGRGSVGM